MLGELQTPAKFIREFVRSHPAYRHDSVVSQEINYDLLKKIDQIERGKINASSLLGDFYRPVSDTGPTTNGVNGYH
jgi:glutamate--cysteine ligase catalytic subunit